MENTYFVFLYTLFFLSHDFFMAVFLTFLSYHDNIKNNHVFFHDFFMTFFSGRKILKIIMFFMIFSCFCRYIFFMTFCLTFLSWFCHNYFSLAGGRLGPINNRGAFKSEKKSCREVWKSLCNCLQKLHVISTSLHDFFSRKNNYVLFMIFCWTFLPCK